MTGEVDAREWTGLRRELESPDDEVRRLACERLTALPTAEATPRLVECLGDPSWRVRKAAIEGLARAVRSGGVVDALVAALGDGENPGRRNAAVEALVRCGRRAVSALLEATRTPDADVRKLVVDALGAIGAPETADRLCALLDDPDPNVRAAAADAVGAVAGPGAEPALRGVVQRTREDVLVRLAALRALARLDAPLTVRDLGPALDEPMLRPAAFAVLGRTDDPEAAPRLLKGLESRARTAREAAIEGLLRLVARSAPDESDALVAQIRDVAWALPEVTADAARRVCEAELGVRLVLVQFLGVVGGRGVVRPLLRAARDEALTAVVLGALASLGPDAEEGVAEAWPALENETRRIACAVLARTDGERGFQVLERALDEPDPELRVAAARALGARGDVRAVEPLARALDLAARPHDLTGAEERAALAAALVDLADRGDAEARTADHVVARLAVRLDAAPDAVREATARVLAVVAGAHHASLVGRLVCDPSAAVRAAAVPALGRIGNEEACRSLVLALADEAPAVRIAAASTAGILGPERAAGHLEPLLCDPEPPVRAAVARALGACLAAAREAGAEPTGAAERITALLLGALDDVPAVALTALEGLEVSPEMAPALARLLPRDDVELVCAVVSHAARLPDAPALELLVPLVGHGHWAVRAAAVEALADRGLRRGAPAMLRRLEVEQDTFVREALLRALARLEA